MATDVIMPKVDMDQETGTVAQWLKKEGETVQQGETILEIETDKVAIDVEAPATGILTNIVVTEGETVPIATVIATILAPGETYSLKASHPESDEIDKEAVSNTQPFKSTESGNSVPITPVARKLAEASGVDLTKVTGTGLGGKVTKKDVEEVVAMTMAATGSSGKVCATPAARRIAVERAIALESITGSGPDGRIQANDVMGFAQLAETTPVISPTITPGIDAAEIIPLRGKRRTIAERLTASYQSVPHIHFTTRIDMTRFNDAREALNNQVDKEGRLHISATALLTKIVAETLVRHRWLNSSFQSGEDGGDASIRLYREVNLGVAVALEDGLIVPVIRDAAKKSVVEIAGEVNDLAKRAKEGQLHPSEVRGGTFTISNLGPFGVEQFTAIINPPQAAILAVGETQPEVVPNSDGQIVVRPVMHVTLAADHRVIDGAIAANFISELKTRLEAPILLLL